MKNCTFKINVKKYCTTIFARFSIVQMNSIRCSVLPIILASKQGIPRANSTQRLNSENESSVEKYDLLSKLARLEKYIVMFELAIINIQVEVNTLNLKQYVVPLWEDGNLTAASIAV